MEFLVNDMKDFVINKKELKKIKKYINITNDQLFNFIMNIFNSDEYEVFLKTDNEVLSGKFISGNEFENKKNILLIKFNSKLDKSVFAEFKFEALFFDYEDQVYKKINESELLSKVEYPYVYISKLLSDESFVMHVDLLNLKIPFSWFEKNGIINLLNKEEGFKSLLLFNFGEKR
jgi:hypothetical protein